MALQFSLIFHRNEIFLVERKLSITFTEGRQEKIKDDYIFIDNLYKEQRADEYGVSF